MRFNRGAGILLHPTSLPGKYPIGDIGPAAFQFIKTAAEAGQTYWQMLPVGPTGYGDSPYQSLSAFAGNTLFISPEELVEDGLIDKRSLDEIPVSAGDMVNFAAAGEIKHQMLEKSFERVEPALGRGSINEFNEFEAKNHFWLDDYALYRALKKEHSESSWADWPDEFKFRDLEAIERVRGELSKDILFLKFSQFIFFRQWGKLREISKKYGIKLIGDVPIFAAYDSADVWCNQNSFKLNDDGSPQVVAGVPPDHFSKTGQLWGNPIYDWDLMLSNDFEWWAAVMYRTFGLFDIVRLDHFRGFLSAWEVPGEDETAENGTWVDVPGRELFMTLKNVFGDLPIIIEDLGFITDEVNELRDEMGFAGMKVLQFAFGGDASNHDLPHNYSSNCVVYTGTHDNDTTAGWWNMLTDPNADDKSFLAQAEFCKRYLNFSKQEDVVWPMIRAAYGSVADLAVIPMQDILSTGSDGRMNTPSTIGDNWKWRYSDGEFTPQIAEKLKDLSATYGR